MLCAKCGTKNADSDRFCAKCGTPLNSLARQTAPTTPKMDAIGENGHQLFCAKCGTQNPDSYKFCAKCGTPLISPARQAAPATLNMDAVIMDATGVNAQLELLQGKIRIKRKDKEIYLSQISSIQLKEAGALTNGYIQFAYLGGTEAKGGLFESVQDQNTILFTKQQQKTFEDIKQAIDETRLQNTNSPSTNTGINDLEKLAELKAKGIITEDEFAVKKKQILGL